MKKASLVAGGLLAFGLPIIGSVNASATDLTKDLKIYEGGSTQLLDAPVWTYDADNDINHVGLTTSLSKDKLAEILNYRAGSPESQASQGVIFITLDVNAIVGGEDNQFAWTRNTGWKIKQPTTQDAFNGVSDDREVNGRTSVWPFSFFVQYKDGDKWVSLSDGNRMTDGTKTVQQLLNEVKPGTYDVSTYNDTWRVSAYTAFENLWKFFGHDKSNVEGNKIKDGVDAERIEQVAISYKIKFPISGTTNAENSVETYFVDLNKAFASDAETVTVNENLEITDTVKVPEGKKLVIAKDVKVSVAGNGKLEAAEGQVTGDGVVVNVSADGKEEQVYPEVKPDTSNRTVESEGGVIKVSGNLPNNVAKVVLTTVDSKWNLTGGSFEGSEQKIYEIVLVDADGKELTVSGAALMVEIDVPKSMAEKAVTVYYIKETADGKPDGFELLRSVREGDKIKFSTTHFSKYALVARAVSEGDESLGGGEGEVPGADESPETGAVADGEKSAKVTAGVLSVVALAAAAGFAAWKVWKKNTSKEA